ncbi:MAG: N-acetylmuramoyl-L-alanine amidase, partial [Bdellovibrionales bacterium]|nr:N-acetylmuramoyl-L-alanine amidase [Bdellovibrionales bacterium]
LIQNFKLEDSITLAHHVQSALVSRLSRYYSDVRDLGVKKAPFYVLVGAHMPCVLVEVSFMDHPVEGRRLIERRYQRLVAESLYRGIRDFFERTS